MINHWSPIIELAWLPLITAFIGWLTNFVAIRMLFRPRVEQRFLGFRWQGLIPRRQAEVAKSTAEIIEAELLNQHVVRAQLQKMDFIAFLDPVIHKLVHQTLKSKLSAIPLVGSFISQS